MSDGKGSPIAAMATLVVAAIAMGASPIFVRLADVGPFASAFWRVALSLPLLLAWMLFEERGNPPQTARAFTKPVVLAGLAFTGDLFFWHLSIVHTSVANATFFATTAPVWVVAFGWLLFAQKPSLGVLLGLGLCLLGGAALVWQSFAFNPEHLAGDAYGLCTAVFFGLYFLSVGAARQHTGAARVTFEFSIVTTIGLGMIAAVLEPRILPHSWQGWAAVVALACISHVGGQGMLSLALGRLPALFSSLVIFLEAIAAATLGWIVLSEPVSLVQGFGGLLILCGIYIARPQSRDKTQEQG